VATAGAQGVLRVNLILVPLLVVVTMIVALMAPTLPSADHSAPGWWISAGLFVSYNLFTGLVVLLGLGQQVSSGLESGLASGLAAIVLTALALVVHRALLSYGGETDIPLFWAAQSLGGGWPHLFGGALYAALFTTGVAEAFALQQRYGTRALAWSLGLWPFSWLGFSTLVAILYPIMGAFAVLFWLPLLCSVRSR
jgi:uncharacterized membrane protein YkvI